MTYISLYRKWRPQQFSDVIGQTHVTRTLQNALNMGRLGHAYLFSGPRGTGKTTVAKLLAKALNCKEGPSPQPCDQCENCQQIKEGVSMDVIEIDGASNRGIDEIRDLREKVRFVPSQGRYKVYIIDEVHMLTTEAFNALLKTLEEPPQHVVFVFATTEPHKVPATIISRCQSFEFHRIPLPDLVQRLTQVSKTEDLRVSETALHLIARSAQGGLRDALSILDQAIAFSGQEITVDSVKELLGAVEFDLLAQFTSCVERRDLVKALGCVEQVLVLGKDLTQFVTALLEYWRDLMIFKATGEGLEEYSDVEREQLQAQSKKLELDQLTEMISVLGEALPEVRRYQSKLPLELATIRICAGQGREKSEGVGDRAEPFKPEKAKPEKAKPDKARTEVAAKPNLANEAVKLQNPPQSDALTESSEEFGQWQEFLQFLKSKKMISLQALLKDATPQLQGSKLWLVYKPEMTFHRDNINKNNQELAKTIQEFYKKSWEVEAICGDLPNSAGSGKLVDSPKKEKDPVVQKAVEMFGASIVKIEDR